MARLVIYTIFCINCCLSDWVLVPSISLKQNEIQLKSNLNKTIKTLILQSNADNTGPDMHNLTMMSFAKTQEQPKVDVSPNWEITMEVVKALIKENEKIPKSTREKRSFVRTIEENLMIEAERQIRYLFHSKSRQARFTGLQFPSMEGSLMTISMLLFGVYLSKLIVRLLQSHYGKYNMPIRTLSPIQGPIILTQNRRTRSTFEVDIQKLQFLDLINKYKLQFN